MTEKIYGVTGLMEWEALIVCGKARLRVRFEGGSSSGFGDAPAIYRTSNPAAQHIIENSSYFREKRIRLLRINRWRGAEGPLGGACPTNISGAEGPLGGGAEGPLGGACPTNISGAGGAGKGGKKDAKRALVLEEKHFNDALLARRFLHDEFGVPMNKLLGSAAIRQQGELYGFKLTWDK